MEELKLYSTEDVAQILGRTHTAVRLLARRRGIGRMIGNGLVFTEADLQTMRNINPLGGRPRHDGQPVKHKEDMSGIKMRGVRKKDRAPTEDE